ncbi:MAG: RsmB/NOP family class I SAM-dependent RNA methyltransferase, partial [Vicinamibacteria bacterium]
ASERLDPGDRAFLLELVLGTMRHRGALDHALSAHVDRGLDELDPDVLTVLRLGAYQILRLRVAARAAVSEAVDLAREQASRAGGLVNAVLRGLVREGPPPPVDAEADPLAWLSTDGSLPRWLAERWIARLGAAGAVTRAKAFLEPPATTFRLNPRCPDALSRAEAAGCAPQSLPVPGAWRTAEGRLTELAAAGILYTQDAGSQMVALLASDQGRVLDACAAPGGKTLLLDDQIGPGGRVIAAEGSPRRVRTLARLVRQWGSTNTSVLCADLLRAPFRGSFSSVLVDAPCSGLGTLSRHPDIRWRIRPADLPRHSARQKAMIESGAALVAPRGKLVYATCSSEPEENEAVVHAFLAGHPEFVSEALPGWAAPFADGSFARTRPEADSGDAFFAAVLRRA